MKKKEQAINLFQSIRGEYIIGQALYLAIESINKRPQHQQEPSNVVDMLLLMNQLFPIYSATQQLEKKRSIIK